MLSNLTTTIKSWELLPDISMFLKNITSSFRYSILLIKKGVILGLLLLCIYGLISLTIFIVLPIILFAIIQKIKSKKENVTSMKFFVFFKKMVEK